MNEFKKQTEWCKKTNDILVVSTDNSEIIKNLELPRRPPLLLHIVHNVIVKSLRQL